MRWEQFTAGRDNMSGKNGVVKRIELLTRSWLQFSEQPRARILRWRLPTEAARLVDCFLAFHQEETSNLSDLFLPVVIDANDVDHYWLNVLRQILSEIDDARDDLAALELPTDWESPEFASGTAPAHQLVLTLASYQEFYHEFFEHAVLVLLPSEIASRELWIECLDALLQVPDWPASVRIIVPDWLPETILHDWSIEHSAFVENVTPRLDMPGLPLELLAHLPGTGPGFEFRRLFVQLGAAAGTGQLALVSQLADKALCIATEQGWYALAATVQLLVGSVALGAGDSQQVLAAYRSARQMAAKIEDPTGPKVAVTSTFAEAGALLGDGEYDKARRVYREAAEQADASEETFSSLEARRMASYCSEANGDFDEAWREGQEALQLAQQLESAARVDSTLPALLHRLQEMAARPEGIAGNVNIDQQCADLLGTEWTGVLERTRKLLS